MTDIDTNDQSKTVSHTASLLDAGMEEAEAAGKDEVDTGGGVEAQLSALRENVKKFELAKKVMVSAFTSLGIQESKIKYGPDFANIMGYQKLPDIDQANRDSHHNLFVGMFFSFDCEDIPKQHSKYKGFFTIVKEFPGSFLARSNSKPMFFVYQVNVTCNMFQSLATLFCLPISALQHIKKKLRDKKYCFKPEVSPSSFMKTIIDEIKMEEKYYQEHLSPIEFSLIYNLIPVQGDLSQNLFATHVKEIECMGYINQDCMNNTVTVTGANPAKKPRPEPSTTQLQSDKKAIESALRKMHTLRFDDLSESQEELYCLKCTAHNLEKMKSYSFQGADFPPDTLCTIIDGFRRSTCLGARHENMSEKHRTMRNLVNYLCELRLEDLESGTFRDLTTHIEDFLRTATLKAMHKTDPNHVGDYVETICSHYPFYPDMEEAVARYEDAEDIIQRYGGYFKCKIMISDVLADTTAENFADLAVALANCTNPEACKDAPTEDQRTEAKYYIADFYKKRWDPTYIKNSMEGAKFYLMLHCHPQLCSFGCERQVFRLLVHLRFFDKYKSSPVLLALLKEFAAQFLAEKADGIELYSGIWAPSTSLSLKLDEALKVAEQDAVAAAAAAKAAAKAAAASAKASRKVPKKKK